jgi:cell wall-associated NlpC family hydrolase
VLLLLVLILAAAGGSLMGASPASACQLQPAPSTAGRGIPADYLAGYIKAGRAYGIPWTVLAGIGEVESDHGRSDEPGVHSGTNAYGAAGPMQFGVGGVIGDTWGGAPVHPASQHTGGYGIDGDGDGVVDVYDPGDAIPSAAAFLVAHGAPGNIPAALTAWDHLPGYVTQVMGWTAKDAATGTTALAAAAAPACQQVNAAPLPAGTAGKILAYAEQQLGKPYLFSGGAGGQVMIDPRVCPAQMANGGSSASATGVVDAGLSRWQRCVAARVILFAASELGKPYAWGATGPDAFDCSGLTMMAYRSAGVSIPRTSQEQWAAGPYVLPGQEEPGDLVFFRWLGRDGASPGACGHRPRWWLDDRRALYGGAGPS